MRETSLKKAYGHTYKYRRGIDSNSLDMKQKVVVIVLCLTLLVTGVLTIPSGSPAMKKQEQDKNPPIQTQNTGIKDVLLSEKTETTVGQKNQLSFAVFTDTHIGTTYQNPLFRTARYLDLLGEDLVESTNLLDFAVHLGDIVHHNTAHVNGISLPWYVNQYKNNLKAYFIEHIHIPLHIVLGNHDLNDYQMNKQDPYNLTKSLIDELCMNNPVYAMMCNGILFLIVPELAYVTWTHQVEYEWIEFMTTRYRNTTTIILCHQAIEDTTAEESLQPYRGKQDMDWWAKLFRENQQIKMWIHGHNHMLDWYVNNQSTGLTNPVWDFGHEIAFSSPYPQMEWNMLHEEDRIVIYNITSSGMQTASWENNGYGGRWISEYQHSWDVPTTFDPNISGWYSFPMVLQDNETQLTDMKILSPHITLQLVGTTPMEFFFDSEMESPDTWADETILGFGNDRSGNVEWMNPGMRVHGPTVLNFPEKYPYSSSVQEDGRSGQPYHSFPMGTICAAVPGQRYIFTITARCLSGSGRIKMNISCSDWQTKTQYSVLSGSEQEVLFYTVGSDLETIVCSYMVPQNKDAWFLQGIVEFLDAVDYEVSLFSVKRERSSDTTDDFSLCLSGQWYNHSGVLEQDAFVNFSVRPQDLCDQEGVMNFTGYIRGNKCGMVNLVYHEPVLMGTNARFRINDITDTVYNLSLIKTITRVSPIQMAIWNSKMFEKFPRMTELRARFLMKAIPRCMCHILLKNSNPDSVILYQMTPFSTNPLYAKIEFTAVDKSAVRHVSSNGNVWFTCHSPCTGNRFIEVKFPDE